MDYYTTFVPVCQEARPASAGAPFRSVQTATHRSLRACSCAFLPPSPQPPRFCAALARSRALGARVLKWPSSLAALCAWHVGRQARIFPPQQVSLGARSLHCVRLQRPRRPCYGRARGAPSPPLQRVAPPSLLRRPSLRLFGALERPLKLPPLCAEVRAGSAFCAGEAQTPVLRFVTTAVSSPLQPGGRTVTVFVLTGEIPAPSLRD